MINGFEGESAKDDEFGLMGMSSDVGSCECELELLLEPYLPVTCLTHDKAGWLC